MNNEEKKAINNLNFIIVTDVYDNEVSIDKTKIINEYNESVGIVLNLIENQEKEIERLKEYIKENKIYKKNLFEAYEEQEKEIERLKKDNINLNDQLQMTKNSVVIGNLDVIEDKKEEMYSIAKANYDVGMLEERSQWYKKINEKIEEYQEKRRKAEVQIVNDMYVNYINCLKELIGKEE